jgi:hypothetical protein
MALPERCLTYRGHGPLVRPLIVATKLRIRPLAPEGDHIEREGW